MNFRSFLFAVLFISSLWLPAQAFQITNPNQFPQTDLKTNSQTGEDALTRHLSAAETYQLSGDYERAGAENRIIASIALQRLGNIAVREGQLKRAVEILSESIIAGDNAEARTNLASAYMQLGQVDEGLAQAQAAVYLDAKNGYAQQTLGKLFYMKSDYAAALPALERALVLQPDFDSAYTLGMTYLQLKQIDRAKLLFEEMQVALKKNAALHVLFGQAFEETNYPLEAEREFKKAVVIDPKVSGAHFYLGYLILQHGGSERLAEAGKEFELELQLNPQNAYSNFFAGVVASSENDHPKAIRYLQQAIRLNPGIGPAYLFLGQSQAELGENAAAEKSLRKAIELNDDVSKNSFQIRRAHFLLGRLLNKLGRREEGEKELAKARELQGQLVESARDEIRKTLGQVANSTKKANSSNPVSGKETTNKPLTSPQETAKLQTIKNQLTEILAQAYHNLGVIAAQQGQIEDGIASFVAAARWKPDFPGLDRNWGIVSFRANQFDKAVAPLARHLKSRSDDLLARRMLGVSYYFTKNYKLAAETLKPIESTLAADPELAYFYGISLVQLQRHREAAVTFARLADQNQKSAQARFYAGQGFVLTGDYERAVKEFRAAATLDAKLLQAHYSAGQSLIRMNRLDEAEKEFRQELVLNPADESAKYHLAYILLERKTRIDEALSLLKEAIAARYDYADARYQLGKALIEKGELNEAVEQLEIAATLEPKKDYIRYQLSIAYRRAARPIDADRELKLYRELKAANRSETPAGMETKQNEP
ncbi:MAG TPA: tetratricopeptide repeat protein [Pyrinomonadaceae bacterium]|jgi:tetratricopeptide (TPR) repeat protein